VVDCLYYLLLLVYFALVLLFAAPAGI